MPYGYQMFHPEPPDSGLRIKFNVTGLKEANRHELVEWLRGWARDIEARAPADIPDKIGVTK
jgi:hypothetical protein